MNSYGHSSTMREYWCEMQEIIGNEAVMIHHPDLCVCCTSTICIDMAYGRDFVISQRHRRSRRPPSLLHLLGLRGSFSLRLSVGLELIYQLVCRPDLHVLRMH